MSYMTLFTPDPPVGVQPYSLVGTLFPMSGQCVLIGTTLGLGGGKQELKDEAEKFESGGYEVWA
jgi:hypothetical protein